MEVQVTMRSPTPASPAKVSFRAPRATPRRAISVSPRVISMALVLSPQPMPSQQPAHRAMTFFNAAPISTPVMSGEVYMRSWRLINRSWASRAASRFPQATTTAVGTPRPTSSAWEGPDSTTTGFCPSSSCSTT